MVPSVRDRRGAMPSHLSSWMFVSVKAVQVSGRREINWGGLLIVFVEAVMARVRVEREGSVRRVLDE
jgi:hypothetical protein